MTSVYLPTASGFRIYVRTWDNTVLTPTDAQTYNWHVNWLAVTGSTTIVRKYYSAGNQRIAMRENGSLRWLLGDHLGSTAYTVNGTAEAGEVRYRAFGATRFTSGLTPTSYRYTGQREEAGLGLYYYGARWYDPALGHFIQPDTLIPQPGNVLDYHRYSYVRFNPLKYTDPSGHCVATAASVAGALVSGGGSLALSPSSLAFDAACWAAVVAAIQLSNNLATNPPAFPEVKLPDGNESYPLTVAEPQIYAQPVGSDLEVGVTIQGISADSTLQIGNVLADPLPGVDPTGHIYAYSSRLDKNMQQAGITRPPDTAAHHIVAANDPRAATARGILASAGIGINDAVNGVYLPANQNASNPTGANVHSPLHTRRYHQEVETRLLNRGNQSVQSVLQQIRQDLQNGTFPYR